MAQEKRQHREGGESRRFSSLSLFSRRLRVSSRPTSARSKKWSFASPPAPPLAADASFSVSSFPAAAVSPVVVAGAYSSSTSAASRSPSSPRRSPLLETSGGPSAVASSAAAAPSASGFFCASASQQERKKRSKMTPLAAADKLQQKASFSATASSTAAQQSRQVCRAAAAKSDHATNVPSSSLPAAAAASSSFVADAADAAASLVDKKPRTSFAASPVAGKKRKRLATVSRSASRTERPTAPSPASPLLSSFSVSKEGPQQQQLQPAAKQRLKWKRVLLDAATLQSCQMEGMTELEELDGAVACIYGSNDKVPLRSSDGISSAARRSSAAETRKHTAAGAPSSRGAAAAVSARAADSTSSSAEGAAGGTEYSAVPAPTRPRASAAAAAAAVEQTRRKKNKKKEKKTVQQQQQRESCACRGQQEKPWAEQQQQQQEHVSGRLKQERKEAAPVVGERTDVSSHFPPSEPFSFRVAGRSNNGVPLAGSTSPPSSTSSKHSRCDTLSARNGSVSSSKESTCPSRKSSISKSKVSKKMLEGKEPLSCCRRPCSLEESTEQWTHVMELRQQLRGWMSLVEAQGEEDSLHPAVLRALVDQRFFHPTPVQQAVLLHALRDRRDVIAAAETGSGKTLAYGVPIVCCLLAQMLRRKEKAVEKQQRRLLLEEEEETDALLQQQRQRQQSWTDLDEGEEEEEAWRKEEEEKQRQKKTAKGNQSAAAAGVADAQRGVAAAADGDDYGSSGKTAASQKAVTAVAGSKARRARGTRESTADDGGEKTAEGGEQAAEGGEQAAGGAAPAEREGRGEDAAGERSGRTGGGEKEVARATLRQREAAAAAEGEVGGPECLVLVPSRELAAQVQQHLSALCIYTPIRCLCLVGGLSIQKQQRLLAQQKPQILVATPGRLYALLQQAQAAVQLQAFAESSFPFSAECPVVAACSAAPAVSPSACRSSAAVGDSAPVSARGLTAGAAAATEGIGTRRRLQEEAHAYLSRLDTVRFLVLDEADRLVREGSFMELDEVLRAIYAATGVASAAADARPRGGRQKSSKRSTKGTDAIEGPAAGDDGGKGRPAAPAGEAGVPPRTAAAAGSSFSCKGGSAGCALGGGESSRSSSRLQTFVLSATLGLSEEELLLRVRKGRVARAGDSQERRQLKSKGKAGRNSSSSSDAGRGRSTRGEEEALPAAKGIQQLMERVRFNTSRLCVVDLCSSSSGGRQGAPAVAAAEEGAAGLGQRNSRAAAAAAAGQPSTSGGERENGRADEEGVEARIAAAGRGGSRKGTESNGSSNALVLHGGLVKLPDGLRISCLKTDSDQEELYLALFLLKLFLSTPVKEPLKVLIFVNAISYVYRLDPLLSIILGSSSAHTNSQHLSTTAAAAEVFGLHAQLQQKQRMKRVERFQAAKRAVLVCTDVASRGLDMQDIKYVVHFQPPRTPSLFVHRSGRTARAKQAGECVCVCSPALVDAWLRVAKPLQIDLAALPAPAPMQQQQQGASRGVYSQLPKVKRIFSLATEIESAKHKDTKERRMTSWLKKAAASADILLDSDMSDEEGGAAHAKKLRSQQKELAQLLSSLKFARADAGR